jgi:hypothetical protein
MTLWLPEQPDPDERLMVCRVVTGPGEICGMTFTRPDVWQRHVGRCARAHMDEIRAESLRARMPVFDEESWDPEVSEHMAKVGARMKAEGRLEVKPSERAGFS